MTTLVKNNYSLFEYVLQGERRGIDLKAPIEIDEDSYELVDKLEKGEIISIDLLGTFEVSWISKYDVWVGSKLKKKVTVYLYNIEDIIHV